MKRLLITGLAGVGIAVTVMALSNFGSTVDVVNKVETIEVEKVIEIKELDQRIEQAQDTARLDIEAKAKTAYDSAYEQGMKEVKLEVVSAYKAEVEAMETSLSKEVGTY